MLKVYIKEKKLLKSFHRVELLVFVEKESILYNSLMETTCTSNMKTIPDAESIIERRKGLGYYG